MTLALCLILFRITYLTFGREGYTSQQCQNSSGELGNVGDGMGGAGNLLVVRPTIALCYVPRSTYRPFSSHVRYNSYSGSAASALSVVCACAY